MTFRSPDDPYRDRKKYHLAAKMDQDGRVSALCFKRPTAINLKLASWVFRSEAVTCQACLRLLKQKNRTTT